MATIPNAAAKSVLRREFGVSCFCLGVLALSCCWQRDGRAFVVTAAREVLTFARSCAELMRILRIFIGTKRGKQALLTVAEHSCCLVDVRKDDSYLTAGSFLNTPLPS